MRYSPQVYAAAFLAATRGGAADSIHRLLELVREHGDLRKLPVILEAVEQSVAEEGGGHRVVVESARELTEENLHEITAKFTNRDIVRTEVTPALLAGVRVTVDGEWVVDASLERKLRKLFRG